MRFAEKEVGRERVREGAREERERECVSATELSRLMHSSRAYTHMTHTPVQTK